MNNDIRELQALQCTYQVRNIILPFVDEICGEVKHVENFVVANKTFVITQKRAIPKLYRNTGMVTILLCGFGVVSMFADTLWSFTGLNPSTYIIWCLCCISLFFTNKHALEEWKTNNRQQ